MKIVVTERKDANDYHACLNGRPEIWCCGKTQDEAIGSLIRTHAEIFKIEVEQK
jgi:hypothetical protein